MQDPPIPKGSVVELSELMTDGAAQLITVIVPTLQSRNSRMLSHNSDTTTAANIGQRNAALEELKRAAEQYLKPKVR